MQFTSLLSGDTYSGKLAPNRRPLFLCHSRRKAYIEFPSRLSFFELVSPFAEFHIIAKQPPDRGRSPQLGAAGVD